ncbi:MAG: UDP-2,3-diacylglucosamine diphosphatase [Gallionellales bacterium RIFOXYB12_FULL_54_9]|nr:MAG: UDP-2,3-diacylglucosamine diphosphatase [Gallionellales bacterium RIFOXYB12_FULL_54_9]
MPNPDTPHSLFISDLHLSADHPHSTAAFDKFIATVAFQAESLYILGDLFEYWAGDDDLHDPFYQHVINAFRSLTTTRVYLMHGNRDLLMGEELARACNATLLADPSLIDLYGTSTLISHGDALCTDDLEYQKFRALVHSIDFKEDFLAKSLAERKAYIEQLRRHSENEKKTKNMAIMDVNSMAVAALLREFHYPRLIHGHTHRTARHEHLIEGHLCERWVLSDWDNQVSVLRCDPSGIRFQNIS